MAGLLSFFMVKCSRTVKWFGSKIDQVYVPMFGLNPKYTDNTAQTEYYHKRNQHAVNVASCFVWIGGCCNFAAKVQAQSRSHENDGNTPSQVKAATRFATSGALTASPPAARCAPCYFVTLQASQPAWLW